MDRKTENIARLIKLNIAEVDAEALVILYGSRARGDAGNRLYYIEIEVNKYRL